MGKPKKDKRVKQINNLTIVQDLLKSWIDLDGVEHHNPHAMRYDVWTPDGTCIGTFNTYEKAYEFCESNKDYVKKKGTKKNAQRDNKSTSRNVKG